MAKQENFETSMKKLNDIVDKLEKNDVDLDASIKLYEEGLQLSKSLKDELKKFEDKISKLSDDE